MPFSYLFDENVKRNIFLGLLNTPKLWILTKKIERLRDFIITLLTNGMSLTDVHILSEEFALRHKTIILSINNNKFVSIGSIIYN